MKRAIISIFILCSLSFAQEKPKAKPEPRDTVLWVKKAEIEKELIEQAQKQLDAIQSELVGQRKLLSVQPDSIQIKKKIQ